MFLNRIDVEPTNNGCERDFRPSVVHRKVIGGHRSARRAHAFAVLGAVSCPDVPAASRSSTSQCHSLGSRHRRRGAPQWCGKGLFKSKRSASSSSVMPVSSSIRLIARSNSSRALRHSSGVAVGGVIVGPLDSAAPLVAGVSPPTGT
ncbi:MAG: transposase [Chloroflexi bacterium]|nr:transposase [Chloroflexota bacterium]